MDTIEAIHSRRSIRRYSGREVGEKAIEELIRAAMQAPSAGNEQPWHFIVVSDKAILTKISEIHIYGRMTKEAAAAVIVCGDLKLQAYEGLWMLDCSAAVQNLLLAAHNGGLGAVWCAIYPDEGRVKKFQQLFKLPDNVIPFALVPIGHPGEIKSKEDRFKPERVHKNKW